MSFNFVWNPTHNSSIDGMASTKAYETSANWLWDGISNWWYSNTGQTEKTSAYKAQMAREDTAYQRAAADMQAAGLSKFGGVTPAASGSSSGYANASGVAGKGLAYVSALMDIKEKRAGIDYTKAQRENVEADTALKNKQVVSYDENLASIIAERANNALLAKSQADLAKIEGSFRAEKITAEIGYVVQQTALDFARVNNVNSSTNLNIQQKENLKNEFKFTTEKIITEQVNRNNLSAQSAYIVAQTTYENLLTSIAQYNYDVSKSWNRRTTDPMTSLSGSFMGASFSTNGYNPFIFGINNKLASAVKGAYNWKGALSPSIEAVTGWSLPSFADIWSGVKDILHWK